MLKTLPFLSLKRGADLDHSWLVLVAHVNYATKLRQLRNEVQLFHSVRSALFE